MCWKMFTLVSWWFWRVYKICNKYHYQYFSQLFTSPLIIWLCIRVCGSQSINTIINNNSSILLSRLSVFVLKLHLWRKKTQWNISFFINWLLCRKKKPQSTVNRKLAATPFFLQEIHIRQLCTMQNWIFNMNLAHRCASKCVNRHRCS